MVSNTEKSWRDVHFFAFTYKGMIYWKCKHCFNKLCIVCNNESYLFYEHRKECKKWPVKVDVLIKG